MGRLQLVELEDLSWFPRILRDGGTAFLEFAERSSGHGRMLVPPLERALDATGETHLVDLCSGGELRELVEDIEAPDWVWDIGRIQLG